MGLNHEHLGVYLNDHLAGSAAALEVLDVLEDVPGFKLWVGHLRREITADRQELQNLMSSLQITEGPIRKLVGKLAGTAGEIKTRLEDPSGGPLRQLELLETLSLGIEGKRTLWVTLQTISSADSRLPVHDYDRLIGRAAEQRQEVEMRRLDVAAAALS